MSSFSTTRPTIFALSSGRGPAAIAVVRISGPRAGEALKSLTGKIPAPRQAALARVRDPHSGDIIDEALGLWFPAPHSETGEDVVELQLHGGRAVIAAVLAALARLEGLRPAEAGEFTRRGFENGKLDLTAVEGLADLVTAETQGQRRQAFRQMKGLLGDRAESWRQKLIQALALVEAAIDFSDEADVPENLVAPALTIARELEGEIALALADGGRGERLREGLVVAIAGPPNAGKSTLLNLLAKREAAIVSPYAGTTRDVIEVHLDLGGYPVTLLDTAGIRDTQDPVEREGVRRARERAAGADLVLWVVDASEEGAFGAGGSENPNVVIPGRPEGPGPESSAPGFRARRFAAPRNDGEHGSSVIPETARSVVIRNPEAASEAVSGQETAAEPGPGFRVPASGRPRNDGEHSSSVIPQTARGAVIRNPEAASAAVSGQEPSAEPGPGFRVRRFAAPRNDGDLAAPPTWLVRNKIDLLKPLGQRSELIEQNIYNREPELQLNDTLKNVPNEPTTNMANTGLRKMAKAPLTNIVNTELTDKNESEIAKNDPQFNISTTSGEGFELLLGQLARHAEGFLAGGESALVTRERHRRTLEDTLAALRRALGGEIAGREDLLAEELRIAARTLGRLTGRVDVEDILDVIFRDFCIGK
jgi:tRNA modification GTPase